MEEKRLLKTLTIHSLMKILEQLTSQMAGSDKGVT